MARSAGQLHGPPCLHNRAAHDLGSRPFARGRLCSTHQDAQKATELRDAEDHRSISSTGSWMVTDHVMALVQALLVDGHRSRYGHQQLREICVGLSGALHSLIGAHAELVLERAPMRRAEANARRYMRVRALWEP